jgi:hypothetical protein
MRVWMVLWMDERGEALGAVKATDSPRRPLTMIVMGADAVAGWGTSMVAACERDF